MLQYVYRLCWSLHDISLWSKTTDQLLSFILCGVHGWMVSSVSPYTCLRAAQSRLAISLVEPARRGLNVSVHVIEVPGAIRLKNTSHTRHNDTKQAVQIDFFFFFFLM